MYLKLRHSVATCHRQRAGKQPPKGGKGSGKGKRVGGGSGKALPHKSGSLAGEGAHAGKRHHKKTQKWGMYIHRTLQQVHKNLTISSRAMTIMGSFVEDMFERIHSESVNVAKINKTKTLTAREVQTSARLLLPGELAKHAMSEGTKSVAKYNTAVAAQKDTTVTQ